MGNSDPEDRENSAIHNPAISMGLISAFLTVINNTVATIGLGVLQGPVVAMTTPFAFCLCKLRYPKMPSATLIYFPLVVVSIFTLNLGPPGAYKLFFMIGPILYDVICYVLRAGFERGGRTKQWKLLTAVIFYVIGLLLGALLAVSFVSVELPLLSRSWVGVAIFVVVFWLIGMFATRLCYRIYYKWLGNEATN